MAHGKLVFLKITNMESSRGADAEPPDDIESTIKKDAFYGN